MKFLIQYFVLFFSTINLLLAKDLNENIYIKDMLTIADTLYYKKQYERSILFYETYRKHFPFDSEVHAKLILNYLRLKENHYKIKEESLKEFLDLNLNEYVYHYISLYGSLRLGYSPLSFSKIYKIENSNFPKTQKEYSKLIFGSIYFEEDLLHAQKYYEKLYQETSTEEVKKITKEILKEIENFHQTFIPKRPFIAGILSTLLPGAGYVYTHHYVDGIFSFFWNSVFLGSGMYMYNLEKQSKKPHTVSSIFLIMGISFYLTNIIGSYSSAIRYNNYHTRIFYQNLRASFFNTDFIEHTSGIEFRIRF